MSETFCDKFSTLVSVTEAKIFATKKRSNAELIEEKKVASETESTKRKKIGCHADNLVSLLEAKQHLKIKQLFESKMKELNDQEITEVKLTRKIPTSKIDAELLNQIDSVIGDYVCLHLPKNVVAVTKCLQAAQCIYWAVC
ncbi:hypothetical protein NUSPORA_02808 [Nucleospora cyclopteri]